MKEPKTFSGTRAAPMYFAAQALAIAAWWVALLARPEWREAFRPPGAEDADLLAFILPDAIVVALSLVAAAALWRGHAWGAPLAWGVAGAIGYATAYLVAWATLRDGAWLAVVAMVPAAVLSAFFALDSSPNVRVFRKAKRRTRAGHLAATALSIVVFWGFFLFVLPPAIAFVERKLGIAGYAFPSQAWSPWLLFAAASALGLWSGVTMASRGEGTPLPMDGTNALVVGGPYRWIRNPMVVAGLSQGLAVVLWLGSWLGLAYVALGAILWHLFVRPAEERELAHKFGAPYDRYRASVPLWIPRRR